MTLSVVILVVGLLLIIEGFFVSLWPQKTKKIVSNMVKNTKEIKGYGIVELIAGLILLLIYFLIKGS